jgi:hypothetical protein
MTPRFPNKPRFPRKRRGKRFFLLLALPLLPLLFLAGPGALFNDDSSGDASMQDETRPPAELEWKEAYPAGSLPPDLAFDKLLLEKNKRRLTAFAGGKAVRVYFVALGQNPSGPKEVQGDKRTPEGNYRIDGKNAASAYHKNLGVSYPNAADRARAKTLNKPPGGDIKIHGLAPEFAFLGQAHRLTDWTHGCIAVTNEEIEELFSRTAIGVPIEILP